ncbi:MAG: FG-GAP-like repeat-containing protein [bacterium]
MIKHLLTIGYCLLAIAYCNASEFRDNYFMDGSLTQVTTSDIPGCKWVRSPKSLKLSSQYPLFEPVDTWAPLPSEMSGLLFLEPEFGDIDNDGDIDLLVGDKATKKIILLENKGTKYSPLFKKRGEFPFLTDGSCSLGDIDKDGILDLLVVYNVSEIHGYKGKGNWEWERKLEWDVKDFHNQGFEFACELGDLNSDNYPDLIICYIEQGTNTGNFVDVRLLSYENKDNKFIPKPEWNPPPMLSELIGNGWDLNVELVDLENTKNPFLVFTFNEWGNIYLYKNTGILSPNWGMRSYILWGLFGQPPEEYSPPGDSAVATIAFADLDGDGDFDMINGGEDGILIPFENVGDISNPRFQLKSYQPLDGFHIMGGITFADLNGDGDYEEIHSEGAGSCNKPRIYIAQNTGTPEIPYFPRKHYSIVLENEQNGYNGMEITPTVADLNGDGKPDLLVATYKTGKGENVGAFRNISTQTTKFSYNPQWNITAEYLISEGLDDFDTSSPAPFLLDLDNDKDYDLLLPTWRIFVILENIGSITSPIWKRNKTWEESTGFKDINPLGYIPKLTAMDLNGDNNDDIVFHGTIYPTKVYLKLRTSTPPSFERAPEAYEKMFDTITHPYYQLSGVDLDNDGDYDLVTGYKNSGPFISGINKGPYHPLGTYTSSIFDAGSSVIFENIFWKERKPFSTELSMYVRSGNSTQTLSSWRKVSNGESLNLNARFIQYQAILSTSDLEYTPTLYEVNIPYRTSNQPFIDANPDKAYPEGTINVTGQWFANNETVRLYLGTLSVATTTSSPNGTINVEFALPSLPAGLYPLNAKGNITATATTYITILPLSAITGRVREENFAPIVGADVFLDGFATKTDKYGKFSFTNLPVATYTLTVSATRTIFTPPSFFFPSLNCSHDVEFVGEIQRAFITLLKVGTETIDPGATLTYTLSFINDGDLPLSGAYVIDTIEDNLGTPSISLITIGTVTYCPEIRTLVWTIGSLTIKECGTMSFSSRVSIFKREGTITNIAFLYNNEAATSTASCTTRVIPPPPPIIRINPGSGSVTKIVTIVGENFKDESLVRIDFGKTRTIATAIPGSEGTFSTTFTVTDESFGTITITATGLLLNLTATTTFFILSPEYFLFGTIPSPQIAGIPFTIKITAYDIHGDIVRNFRASATLSDTSNTIFPTTTTNFTGGIWDGTVTITRAGTSSISAGYQSKTGTSNPFYVLPGEPVKFIVYPENPVYILAGGSVSITAQLIDVYGNAVGSAGISCNLEVVMLSGKPGTLSATTSTTTNTGQIDTITYWVSPNANDKVRIKLLSTLPPATSGTITTSSGELAMFTFDTIATQTAGMNFPIKITARDAYENPIPFTRTVTLIDLSNSLKPTQTTSFINGMWDGFGSITVRGTTSITVIYGDIRGTSNPFWVCGGEVEYFVISTITTQTAGISFPLSIKAYDRWRNIADMFNSSAALTDTSRTISPTKTTNFSLGIWDGTVSITRAGTTAIMASYQGKTGTSNPFFITPSSLDHFLIGTITNQTAGIDFPVVITAKDTYNNTVTSFTDKVELKDTSLTLKPKISDSFSAGIWQGVGSITKAGTTTIYATAQGRTGTSSPFFVNPANLHHFSFLPIPDQIAGIPFKITIIAQDAYQNTVTTYTGTNTLSDTTGSIQPTITSGFVAGELRDFPVTISVAQDPVIVRTEKGGIAGTSNAFGITPGNLDHFWFEAILSPQIAGVEFFITIKAMDKDNNIIFDFSDKVGLNDASQTIFPTSTTAFISGIWQGNVKMTKAGTTSILADYAGKYGNSNVFKVIPGQVAYIEIQPGSVTLMPDERQTFMAKGYDDYGNEKEVGNGKWEVGSEIGTLTNAIGSKTTFVAGTKSGKGTLTCKVNEIIGRASITIIPGTLADINIEPADAIIEVDGSCTFTSRGYDRYGNEKDIGGGNWEVGSEIGELTDVSGTKTTFVAGTKSGKGILTCRVFVPLGRGIKGEERNNEPRVPSPEPRFSEEIIGTASITVRSGRAGRFEFSPISHQIINTKFGIKVTALDRYGNLASDYNQTGSLTTNFGQIKPAAITFYNGIAIGTVTIETNRAAPDVNITIRIETIESQSNDFAVLYDDASNVKVEDGDLKIDIKSHSVSKDYYLKIDKPALDEDEIKIANLRMNHYNPGFCLLTDTIIRIVAKDGDKKPIEGDFGTQATRLIIYYHQPPKNVAEERLKLYILDEESIESRWVEVTNAQVLVGSNFIYGDVPHFGTFILIGEGIPAGFDGVVVYPNPFKPGRGDENIVFEGLPENTQIRIYDISGSLVKDEEGKRATWIWDVRDNYGKKIDSGVYIYVLTTDDGKKKTGKIAIIR